MSRIPGTRSVCAVVMTAGVVAAWGCGRYCDDPITDEQHCEGNLLVSVHVDSCGTQHRSPTDCAAQGLVCTAARPYFASTCVKPCADDEDCAAGEICDRSSSTCGNPLTAGDDCAAQPTHCAKGLVCGPPPPQWDAGVLDAGAGPQADADAATGIDAAADAGIDGANGDAGATSARVCQEDCTHVDPMALGCLPGAPSTCVGRQITTCDCGVVAPQQNPPDPCGVACVIAAGDGHALCALAANPDPRCGYDGFGDYCDGNVIFECNYGYPVKRTACPAGLRCLVFSELAQCFEP